MNQHRENMLAEMGIGPRWILRSTTPAFALSGMQDVQPSKEAPIKMPPQALESVALADVVDAVVCQTCGCAHSLLMAPRIQTKCLFIDGDSIANESGQLTAVADAAVSVNALFQNVLQALQWKLGADTYLASLVKLKPSDQKSIAIGQGQFVGCLDCLKKQIKVLQPTVIVSFGSTAVTSLLGLEEHLQVSDLRGQIRHFEHIPVLTTYDMKHLLAHRKDKAALWVDLCLALSSTPAH